MSGRINAAVHKILAGCPLCSGLSETQVTELLKEGRSDLQTYEKGELIFQEEDKPQRLYILLEGRVGIAKDTLSGKRIIITSIEEAGGMFGEIYLFMQKERYEIHAEALERATVLSLFNLFPQSGEQFSMPITGQLQYNMMCIFAMKAYAMHNKIKILGSAGIREKIVRYLFQMQKPDGSIQGSLAREEMADYMNVSRPSLSRELGKMQAEGILSMNGRSITITAQEAFESYL